VSISLSGPTADASVRAPSLFELCILRRFRLSIIKIWTNQRVGVRMPCRRNAHTEHTRIGRRTEARAGPVACGNVISVIDGHERPPAAV